MKNSGFIHRVRKMCSECLSFKRYGYICFGKAHIKKPKSINNVNLGFLEGIWKL